MYFQTDDALEQVLTPFNRKVVAPGPGGGPRIYVDLQAVPFCEWLPRTSSILHTLAGDFFFFVSKCLPLDRRFLSPPLTSRGAGIPVYQARNHALV